LRPIIKEPAGKWDPTSDQFKDQTVGGGGGKILEDQLDDIRKQVNEIPVDGIKRKTPKKGKDSGKAANKPKEPEVAKKPVKEKTGSGAVVPAKEEANEPYDPAEGI
jgi:hypothetical protein